MSQSSQHLVSCYFCGKNVGEKHLPEHLAHCGAVLEECPNSCGVYVSRRHKDHHREQCYLDKTYDKVLQALNLLRGVVQDAEVDRQHFQDATTSSLDNLTTNQEMFESMQMGLVEELGELVQSIARIDLRSVALEKRQERFENLVSSRMQHTARDISELEKAVFRKDQKAMVSELTRVVNDMKLELEMRCKSSNEHVQVQEFLAGKMDDLEGKVDNLMVELKTLKFQMKDNVR